MIVFIGCSSDDSENTMSVTVSEVQAFQAKIIWTRPSQSQGNVLYDIVLNNQIIAENQTSTQYIFTGLQPQTSYSGIVKALDDNGNETFDEFNFTTIDAPPVTEVQSLFLSTQQEVDAVPSTLTRVLRELHIYGSNITDLSNLSSLQHVGGAIIIDETGLTSLNGLNNLATISNGKLYIKDNDFLSDLTALSGIANQFKELELARNPVLEDLTGLGLMQEAGYLFVIETPIRNPLPFQNTVSINSVEIIQSHNLENLSGFNSLTEVGEFSLVNLNGLTTLQGLNSLTTASTFGIRNCSNLLSVNGLNNLESVGNFYLSELDNLSSLDGLNSLNTVDNELWIFYNPNLTSISGLSSLSSVSEFWINDSPQLESLTGLEGLENLESIQFNDIGITNFDGLNNLKTVQKGFAIYGVESLANLDGLENLESVGMTEQEPNAYSLTIVRSSLQNLEGLESIVSLGGINIRENDLLGSLDGLDNWAETKNGLFEIWIIANGLTDYCAIRQIAVNNNTPGRFNIGANTYNPDWSEVASETYCSQ